MPDETTPPPSVLLLCRDLMFLSKVTATARATGATVQVVRDPTLLPPVGSRLFVDLNQDGALDASVVWKRATGGEVVGFVSHVDADTIARARQSGLDQVLARSQFTANLERLLGE
jgi:hypothetical protein